MKQKTVFIAGLIGLLFGVLFSGTLGLNFFPEDEPTNIVDDQMNNVDDEQESMLKKDEAAFKLAYDLTDSIYKPITGDTAYNKIMDDETFILYAGRDTCPYCQQYVPVLQEAAENKNITMIYHIDTTDTLNTTFVSNENVAATPTTFIYKDGLLVATIIGYKTLADTEMIIDNALS